MSSEIVSLQQALKNLPEDASEAIVTEIFSRPLLQALGFEFGETIPLYNTDGGGITDIAARKTVEGDVFLHTESNPFLLIELKGKNCNICAGSSKYLSTVNQLKKQLLGSKCNLTQWGIITNSSHIQLFRKHGKVVFPATECLAITVDNVDEIVANIKEKIESTCRALTVTVYNNKGGVGKTTTTVNLAGILTFLGKKVLAIDFDLNQQDLSSALGIPTSENILLNALTDKNIELLSAVRPCSVTSGRLQLSFDVIPADTQLANQSETDLIHLMKVYALYKRLEEARQKYDYILIDASPNWRLISQMAVFAADVVLIPTKHNNLFSLENAAKAIKKFIPDMQTDKCDGSPVALPIFFNGEKITPKQLEVAQQEIAKILKTAKTEGFNLLPYFYPKYNPAQKDLHIHEVPSYANIASAAFSRVPAVYRDRYAHDYYKDLAKEYFLQ